MDGKAVLKISSSSFVIDLAILSNFKLTFETLTVTNIPKHSNRSPTSFQVVL